METKTENKQVDKQPEKTEAENFSLLVNECAELSNKLLLKLAETQKHVSASFYKNVIQVMSNRIESNMAKLIERSPEKEILAKHAVRLIQNPEASKELNALIKKYNL